MEHPVFANLPPAQQDALTGFMSLLGPEDVAHLASQGLEAVTARMESSPRYENARLEHVQEKMSTVTAAASMTREESMRRKPHMAVDVALNAEHNFRSARPDWSAGSASSASGSEPMDLIYAEDEEAELLAAEQRAGIRRCRRRRYFECNSTKHLRAYCPLRKKREAPVS
ncbi:hypothetical protein PInf_008177 [Phytophthora infestans]|nr:hypothetical protein PInf_008177 [Phytophthora infestans]